MHEKQRKKRGKIVDRSKNIFGNEIRPKEYRKAVSSKKNFVKKFGDDSNVNYDTYIRKNAYLYDSLGICDIRVEPEGTAKESEEFDTEKGIIVGNIRMGFGHYRISMAIASAAHAMGYTPYWMDLNSFPDTTCTKIISSQNDLYSMGSRISQKSGLFNHFVWEPMNYEGFRKLSYNASDQKNAELMAPVFKKIPKDIPLVATHVWPAQAALHGDMKYVVNAVPDNWPMALHFAEGAVHTVQTHYAYQGYRILNGMDGQNVLREMPAEDLVYTGHYIDHELVANIEKDCEARKQRRAEKKPMRFLLTIGGAGSQKEIFVSIIKYLIPHIEKQRAALYVNVGDYKNVWEEIKKEIPELSGLAAEHFDDWKETERFAKEAIDGDVSGVHAFWHSNIFEAVYCTNLLLRSCDVMVTKPSELSFYPVPKIFIKRVGGHEQWGAVHSAEIGDGTLECRDIPHTLQMIRLFLKDRSMLCNMSDCIIANKKAGIYDGAYRVVELAMKMREKKNKRG